MKWVGAIALVVATSIAGSAAPTQAPPPSPAPSAPASLPASPPPASPTAALPVAPPPSPGPTVAAVACPDQLAPPPPPADEELIAPSPAPLPVPAEPVGGPQLGTCGDIGAAGAPAVGAASWILADLDTGAVLAARAPHARHRPASALKVLTALVTLRRLDPDTVVEGAATDLTVDGSKAGIGPGGHYTVRQLLGGLLLNSGNDTAEALARTLGGGAATVAEMTSLARELGALDTRAATPSGLDGPGMASSAYDLALLFRVAMREPLFAETVATRSIPFPGYGDLPAFELSNSSRLLARYPGAIGAKSGFTEAARHTLVGAAQRGGRRLVVALVRGEQQPLPMSEQAGALLDWGFAQPPATTPVGVLVDAAPAPVPPTTSAEPVPATVVAAPSPPAGATTDGEGIPIGAAAVGALVVVAVGGGIVLRRRTRR